MVEDLLLELSHRVRVDESNSFLGYVLCILGFDSIYVIFFIKFLKCFESIQCHSIRLLADKWQVPDIDKTFSEVAVVSSFKGSQIGSSALRVVLPFNGR